MNKVRHVLGISGGKDSAALAIYMKTKYPPIDIEFYSCDTGKELDGEPDEFIEIANGRSCEETLKSLRKQCEGESK